MDLRKLTKYVNLLGFPYGTIRRIRELGIQTRIQQRKKNSWSNNNKQHGVNVRNLRQILTYNQKNEQVNNERIAIVNIRSINHKEDLLRNAVNSFKINITIVTDSWLQNTSEDTIWVEGSEFNKNGLQIHTCNQQNRKGGGIALIVSSSFKVNQLNTTNFHSFDHADDPTWNLSSTSQYTTQSL